MGKSDEFIMRTIGNWLFGASNTGDLQENFHSILASVRDGLVKADLVTADGPGERIPGNEEECLSHHLHFAETVMALATLSKGGHFVMRMFTLFEVSTSNLLFLIGCHFKELQVYKPGTSNSETSEVCQVLLCTVDIQSFFGNRRILWQLDFSVSMMPSCNTSCSARVIPSRYGNIDVLLDHQSFDHHVEPRPFPSQGGAQAILGGSVALCQAVHISQPIDDHSESSFGEKAGKQCQQTAHETHPHLHCASIC